MNLLKIKKEKNKKTANSNVASRFNDLKVGMKMTIAFLSVSVIILVVAVLSYFNLKTLNDNATTLYNDRMVCIEQLGNAQSAMLRLRGDTYKYFIMPDQRSTLDQSFVADKETVNNNIKAYKATYLIQSEKDEIPKFDSAWADYQQAAEDVIKEVNAGDEKTALQSMRDGAAHINRVALDASIGNLIQIQVDEGARIKKNGGQIFALSNMIEAVASILGVLLAIALGLFIRRNIIRPLDKVTEVARSIAEGDLDVGELPEIASRKDEIGILVRMFMFMTSKLKERIEIISKYELLVESSPDCIKFFDAQGNLTFINKSGRKEHNLITEADVKNFKVVDSIIEEDKSKFAKAFEDAKNGIGSEIEIRHTKEGADREVCLETISPVRDYKQNITGVVGVSRDLTERKKAEERLKELDKLKDDFLMITTHELKTPLVPIKAQCQLLLAGDYGEINLEQKGAMEMIYRNEEALGILTSEVLDVAKIKSGKLRIIPEPSRLEKIVTNVVADLGTAAQYKHITLSLTTLPELPEMFIDGSRIRQVLANLIDNAIKFTPEDGTIKVGVQRQENAVLVSISDTGVGINADNIPKLFEPFFRVESDITHKQRGTGLGLAVSRGLVEAHGGTIKVESAGEGKGSTFTFTLPLSADQKREA